MLDHIPRRKTVVQNEYIFVQEYTNVSSTTAILFDSYINVLE